MVESRLRESRSKAEGDEQGGCEDGVTGRMTGELADEEMDAGRSGLPSKINGGPSTISEQDKQHDESGRDETGRTGRNNVELGILDDNQPGWIFLDVIASSGPYIMAFDRPLLSDLLFALRDLLRKPPALHSFLCTSDLASLFSSIPTSDLEVRLAFTKTYERDENGQRRVHGVSAVIRVSWSFGVAFFVIRSFLFVLMRDIRPERYGCRPCFGTGKESS